MEDAPPTRNRNGDQSASSSSNGSGSLMTESLDASFHSVAVQEAVRHHQLWHGDLLSDADAFAKTRAWLVERLPQASPSPPFTRRRPVRCPAA